VCETQTPRTGQNEGGLIECDEVVPAVLTSQFEKVQRSTSPRSSTSSSSTEMCRERPLLE
jgi:hypothetical protein